MSEDSVSGETVESRELRGSVKWFNVVKGYGFLTPDDGSPDVFLHLSVLRQAGFERLGPGSTVHCEAVRGAKGFQVQRIIEIDTSTAEPETAGSGPGGDLGVDYGGGRDGISQPEATGDFLSATVKWFNPHKGYGFICPEDSEQDVFVHMVTLRRAGVASLVAGQTVEVRVGNGPKGLQVTDIRFS